MASTEDIDWPKFTLADVVDNEENQPDPAAIISRPDTSGQIQQTQLPPLILGCAVFGTGIYSDDDDIDSTLPVRIVRLALRYGVNAFDTSPWYHPSEQVLSRSLRMLADEYPRESYQIITKAGKNRLSDGRPVHDLSREAVRRDVERSLERFGTTYLDVVYLHDVEFTAFLPCTAAYPATLLPSSSFYDAAKAKENGLVPEDAAKSWGDGDDLILGAIDELRKMQVEGKVRKIGIAGYPLPLLLRLSILVLNTAPFQPLDIVQTFSHLNLQNASLSSYYPAFRTLAKVPVVTNASILNMGLLTTSGAPNWHPARKEEGLMRCLEEVAERLATESEGEGRKLEDLAVMYGMRESVLESQAGGQKERLPVVVGAGTLEQVHQAVGSLRRAVRPTEKEVEEDRELQGLEKEIVGIFAKCGWKDWSWPSG